MWLLHSCHFEMPTITHYMQWKFIQWVELTIPIWFGHLAKFCQTYWSNGKFGVVTISYGLLRMYPSTGLCVKYIWYDCSVCDVWHFAELTKRLRPPNSFCTVGKMLRAADKRDPLVAICLIISFDNIVNWSVSYLWFAWFWIVHDVTNKSMKDLMV